MCFQETDGMSSRASDSGAESSGSESPPPAAAGPATRSPPSPSPPTSSSAAAAAAAAAASPGKYLYTHRQRVLLLLLSLLLFSSSIFFLSSFSYLSQLCLLSCVCVRSYARFVSLSVPDRILLRRAVRDDAKIITKEKTRRRRIILSWKKTESVAVSRARRSCCTTSYIVCDVRSLNKMHFTAARPHGIFRSRLVVCHVVAVSLSRGNLHGRRRRLRDRKCTGNARSLPLMLRLVTISYSRSRVRVFFFTRSP